MARKITTEEFILRSQIKHNNFYDYSLSEYLSAKDKVKIICPVHGLFEQPAFGHSSGQGCQKCYDERRSKAQLKDTAWFVSEALEVHTNDEYDYSLVDYKGYHSKVDIVCKKHGNTFSMKPAKHLEGQGCPICRYEKTASKTAMTLEEFIRRASTIHGGFYDYSKVVYKNTLTKVIVICPEHGEYSVTPNNHLKGKRCSMCFPGGYSDKKAGVLYILKVGNITKVGITNKSAEDRCSNVAQGSHLKFKVAYFAKFQDGTVPPAIERSLLNYLRLNYQPVEDTFNGSTECFLDVNYDDLLLHVRHEHLKQLKEHYGN